MENETKRAHFSGKIGFILAASGSAVGLGNLWRFPKLAYDDGGGIFILIYVIFAIFFGLTLMIAEISLGRRTGKSCVDAFGDLSKKYRFIGWLIAIVPLLIVPYYCVIGGWVTYYFAEYAAGAGSFLASSGTFVGFITCGLPGIIDSPILWFLVFSGLVILLVALGVEKGIERASVILMPLLFIMLVGITIYALVEGRGVGLDYYLVPNLDNLSAHTFLDAISQLFYSLSLAMGIMITYGSYMKKQEDIEKAAGSIAAIDILVAFTAGILIIPAVFAFLPDPEMAGGTGLMFQVLPNVFQAMPGGAIVAPVFFILVIFAALTSAISLLETVVSVFMDHFKKNRMVSVAISGILLIALGMLSCLGFGPMAYGWVPKGDFLDFFDFITNSVLMPIGAILTCLFIGYVVKVNFVTEEVESSHKFRLKPFFVPMIKYVCPVLLFIILIIGCGIIEF